MNREFVRGLLVEEAFAYGFTIAFWGCGILVVGEYGLLGTAGVLSYAVGAVTGFGLLAAASFGGLFTTVEPDTAPQYVLSAGVHYLASLVPIGATHVVLTAGLGRLRTLFLVGLAASLLYNLGTMLEELLSEQLRRLEVRAIGTDDERR